MLELGLGIFEGLYNRLLPLRDPIKDLYGICIQRLSKMVVRDEHKCRALS